MQHFTSLLCALSILVWSPVAGAQDEAPDEGVPVDAIESESEYDDWREGLMLGIGILGGSRINGCGDCYGSSLAVGMDTQVGWMFYPDLAILLDVSAVAVAESRIGTTAVSSTSLVQSVAAAAVQWWPWKRLWLKGGVGVGKLHNAFAAVGAAAGVGTGEETGFGLTVATGYEIYQGSLFALDAHGRFSAIHVDSGDRFSAVLGVGFAWYP